MVVTAERVLIVAEVVLAGSAAAFAIARRRGPTSTLAWLFGIVAFPVIGALTYFALANPHVARPRRKKIAAARRVRGENPVPAVAMGPVASPAARSVLLGVSRATGLPGAAGNRVDILVDNVAAFAAKELAIREATRTIWAEYYIVSGDATGRAFLQSLADRAAEGLDVRLLFDAVGSYGIDGEAVARLVAAGGRVAAFHPVNPLRRRWAVHLRTHRKMLVADGTVAFLGGMNIGDQYAGRGGRRAPTWRDTHLRIEGPSARDVAQIFDEDWCFMTDDCLALHERPAACGETTVAILPSGPDQPENAAAQAWFSCIGLAVKRCYLTTPYFAPDTAILRALTTAARRGVDVRVLLPARADLKLMNFVNRSYYPALVEAGVRIFEYGPAMIHAKTLVVDGELGFVGSANVDMRSFQLNFEIGAVIADPAFAAAMEAQFAVDLAASNEVRPEAVRRVRWVAAGVQGAAQLFSPLL